MTHDAWPSSDSVPPESLPRLEDLPVADRGYEQEAVREAFDAFYRHAAQLDVSLRALEAVEVFRRDADALRSDLRALRALGYGGGSGDPDWAVPRYEPTRSAVPAVVLRLAAEAALIVAVAVIAGVAHFRTVVVVALMAVAFVIVALSEWLAGRARFVPPAVAFLPAVAAGEPAPYVEAPAPVPAWGVADEPDEETEPEALTIVASAAEIDALQSETPGAALDPWEQGPAEESPDQEDAAADEADAVPGERAGLFRRRRR
jgi:hypothetical protein